MVEKKIKASQQKKKNKTKHNLIFLNTCFENGMFRSHIFDLEKKHPLFQRLSLTLSHTHTQKEEKSRGSQKIPLQKIEPLKRRVIVSPIETGHVRNRYNLMMN